MTPQQILTLQRISQIKKRDGRLVSFDAEKIRNAIKKAFIAQGILNESLCTELTHQVVELIIEKFGAERIPTVEEVQDLVETVLILSKHAKVAKAYILYRSQRAKLREEKIIEQVKEKKLNILTKTGEQVPFSAELLHQELDKLSSELKKVSIKEIVQDIVKHVYNNMPIKELKTLVIDVAKSKIEKHYEYSLLTSRIIANFMYNNILETSLHSPDLQQKYEDKFTSYIEHGIKLELLNPELKTFNLSKLAKAISAGRDLDFHYLGMQTIYDRYLLREREEPKEVFELPQWMWMRIAMGLSLGEVDRETRAIEFYDTLSQFYVVSSTPTLFNSGTTRSQMSSCFLNTAEDSMRGIFKIYADNALLCKWAGAVGTDWTYVRSKGSLIKGTNGHSQGIVPWIKIFNDAAVAVNQGGKRTGQLAAYLEIWHVDIEEFLELKKNTGDERRRAHDIHTAVWIPDLFMQRVKEKGNWTLFPPTSTPGLHDAYGRKFKELYEMYEKSNIPGAKTIPAVELWKKTLTMLFETGHPWITFKDPCNVRSPQDHVGVVHASNLCTEITLNTNKEETAVCNLASVNLAKFISNGQIDEALLEKYVSIGVRMLNAVIDINFYTIPETRTSNLRHRPIGLGVMGYQDALYQLGIDYDSEEQLAFADKSMEMISYYAIMASSKLAKEFGAYPSFKGSKWDRGLLPIDTLDLLERERGEQVKIDRRTRMDWSKLREHVRQYGMKNSNVMAIAPTATIANISGVVPCVEPIYKNIYVKENMSGNFTIINRYLIDALEERGLWNETILTKIKIHNGSVLNIDEIPADIRRRFKEVFEIDPSWIIKAAALRAKWIDQSASTNIFMKTQSGKAVSDAYMLAWELGLKTTYYLRTLAASQVSKTIEVDAVRETIKKEEPVKTLKTCSIDDENCEACQ